MFNGNVSSFVLVNISKSLLLSLVKHGREEQVEKLLRYGVNTTGIHITLIEEATKRSKSMVDLLKRYGVKDIVYNQLYTMRSVTISYSTTYDYKY